MKIAEGSRPLSIRLFAAICLIAAFIPLFRGLRDPFEAQGNLWSYTGLTLNHDVVIVVLFSFFTIALIPIFWIYFIASPAARWIVVVFGLIRLWPFAINPAYLLVAAQNNPIELAAPFLQIIAIALLFAPDSRQWFANRGTHAAAD